MADSSIILSSAAEAELLKPIDEYVGKIQSQIDALRVDGSDKVQSYKNQIAIAKEDKNLSKDERAKAVAAAKSGLEKAKSVEAANKDKVSKLIAEAEKYLSENYNSKYYDKVVASCEAEKAAENEAYEKVRATIKTEHEHLPSCPLQTRSKMRNMYIRTDYLMHRCLTNPDYRRSRTESMMHLHISSI